MNPYDYDEPYYEPSEYDEKVEEFKQTLRESVKEEIQKELKNLRESNTKMSERLQSLDKLTREAEIAKSRYEREIVSAKKTARVEVQRESAEALLRVLSAPAYRIRSTTKLHEQCNECDEGRKVHYKSPRGKDKVEECECSENSYRYYEVDEMVAWTAARRNRKIMVWHKPWSTVDGEYRWDTIVLKNPEGASLADRMEDYYSYGYATESEAQEVAVALNAQPQDTEEDEW